MTEAHVKLTWRQIAWAVATLCTLLGSWYDTRNQIAQLRQELGFRVQRAELEHTQLWEAIRLSRAPRR